MTRPRAILNLKPGDRIILMAEYEEGVVRHEIVVRERGHIHVEEAE
jgi:hypothetical protein